MEVKEEVKNMEEHHRKAEKKLLEDNIQSLINQYEEAHGVSVKNVYLNNTPRFRDKAQKTCFLKIYYKEAE